MKGIIITSIIQSLLLGVLSYTQGKCKLEPTINYYIYNTTVEIKSYYCDISWDKNFQCEKSIFFSAKSIQASQDLSYYVSTCMSLRCTHPSEKDGPNACFDPKSKEVYYIILCESPAYVNLLENNITLSDHTITRYEDGHYWLKSIPNMMVWSPDTPLCPKIQFMSDSFTVWKHRDGKTKYISNDYMSLKLKENQTFCGTEVWTTNDDEIVVSENYINSSSRVTSGKLLRHPDSCNFHEDCRTSTRTRNLPGIIVDPNENIPEPYKNTTCKPEIIYEPQVNCYVVIVVTLGVLYYLFNVTVNVSLLWTLRKTQNSKLYLLNCVSHILTARFLYLYLKNDEKTHVRLIPPSYGATQNHL